MSKSTDDHALLQTSMTYCSVAVRIDSTFDQEDKVSMKSVEGATISSSRHDRPT